MIDAVMKEITLHKDKAAVITIERLNDLIKEMEDLENGSYHTGYINWAAERRSHFMPSELDFEAHSVIIVATPSPVHIVHFNHAGKSLKAVIPPTYHDFEQKGIEITAYLKEFLLPKGFQIELTDNLPHKLLAVHSGLGLYGKNNICYIPGFGSYANIYTFYSDIPVVSDVWYPTQQMEECNTCNKCATICPTKAISTDQNIINAEICLTSFNEQHGDFPEWLDNNWHNCIVGCMKCQACCPQNSKNINPVINACEYSEEETSFILLNKAGGEYPEGMTEKLKKNGLYPYREVLSRNLSVLIKKNDRTEIEG